MSGSGPKMTGFIPVVIPAEAGPKATPTGGPERSERVSVAHNPKCWDAQDYKDFFPLDLRVKPEDDRFYTRCHSRGSGNPKCRGAQDYKDFFPLDLRVKPEDDN